MKGQKFHVTGTVLKGMNFEINNCDSPYDLGSYVEGSIKRIGTVEVNKMDLFKKACEEVEVPGAQVLLNGKPKDSSKPVRRCGDWVRDAKAKLIAEGIIQACDPPEW